MIESGYRQAQEFFEFFSFAVILNLKSYVWCHLHKCNSSSSGNLRWKIEILVEILDATRSLKYKNSKLECAAKQITCSKAKKIVRIGWINSLEKSSSTVQN